MGQNFLIDKNMKEKILRTCSLSNGDVVLEIGPGLGTLTFDIAGSVEKLVAVEKDKKLSEILKGLIKNQGNLQLIRQDILKLDLSSYFKGKKIKVIGNVPYYITSPILSYLIENRKFISKIFLTVQKEVARRLTASPGAKDYSPISIFTQFYTKPKVEFNIKRGVFYPEPEVDSSFVSMDVPSEPSVNVRDEKLFFHLVRTAFSKRRKTLLNSLTSGDVLGGDKDRIKFFLLNIDINPTVRPEKLSIQEFAKIANSIEN